MRLNKEQKQAVTKGRGPLLIIAGAGTGKTTVITERIKHLIFSKLAKPSEILALTFTQKAAYEMQERVDIAMPYGYTQMWISTFHAFCDRILRAEALHIGLDPRFKLMTQAETIQFVRNNLFKFDLDYFRPLGNPTRFIGGMIQHFSRLQDEDTTAIQYLRWAKSQTTRSKSKSKEDKIEATKWLELANAYKTYEELKIKHAVLDFGDLIVKSLKLFRDRPNITLQYQKQFKYILVDEFQDTNFAQNELAILLASKFKNITVTGDDDQSVYRFRGAAVSNILQFKKHFPKTKVITLTRNYRSGQEILDKAYGLIQFNNPDRLEVKEQVDKKLVAQRKLSGDIRFIHADRVENEAETVADEILKLIKNADYQFKDIAILVRANNHAEPFIRSFVRQGIPHQFLGPGKLFKQPEVVDLISYLKVIYNPDDSLSFYRLLSLDNFKINSRDLAKIGSHARRYNHSLFEVSENIDEMKVSKKTKEQINKIIKVINKHLKLSKRETAGQLLYYFLEETNLLQDLLNPDSPKAEKKVANISKFFDKLKTYEIDHEDATTQTVVDWIELSSELGESPVAADTDWSEVNAVNILTVHSSKGLEFPIVFLVNMVSQRFPSNERREQIPISDKLIKEILPEGDFHIQEERRLCYVGMTRARDRLYFTAANYYGEGKREKRLSPFVTEALGRDITKSESQKNEKQLSFIDYQKDDIVEVETKKLKLQIDYLSYSQITSFQICPLHYKLRYILNIPTPTSAAQSFGISIHEALKDFYTSVSSGEAPTARLMNKILKTNWVAEGYSSKSHETKAFERAKAYLLGFLKNGFNNKNLPLGLEQVFTLPLKNSSTRLRVGGKIDRVDKFPGGKIEIIDYKSGEKVPTQKQVDNDLQLTFYALAASSIKEVPFGKKPSDIVLSLYFLATQEKMSTKRTVKQLSDAKKEIFRVKKEIEDSDFKCSEHFFCRNCEYKLMCNTQN